MSDVQILRVNFFNYKSVSFKPKHQFAHRLLGTEIIIAQCIMLPTFVALYYPTYIWVEITYLAVVSFSFTSEEKSILKFHLCVLF